MYSKQGSEEYNVLNKIKEAMLFIAGLELDVAQDSSANVTFLRECNQSQAEWRRLSDVSGGQRELLMVLSTVHLSGVDNVFLDEPGHSLHPPKQAQLRRWLETKREPGQVLFVITHSTDMISPNWLGALYHMHADEDKYSASCLRGLSRDKPSGEAVKRQDHGDGVGTSSSIHQSSSNIPFDEIVSSGGEKIENEEDFNLDRIVGSKSPSYSKDIDGNGPPSKKQRISDGTRLKLEIKVGPEMIDFLMGVEMRRLFFSSGAIFVEGDTDRRIIQALRAVELDKVNDTMNGRDCSLQKWHDAVKETQMDRWDIIPIYGSANWLKAYTAAKDLKIPFVVVLDADVLNKKIGSAIHPITFEDWNRCRLKETVERSRYPNNHPLNTMVEKVEELTKDRSNKGQLEIRVRKEIANYNLWVWPEGDLEDLFFKNEQVKNGLVQNEQFISKIEELGVKQPREINSGRNPMPADSAEENFRQHVDYFKSLVEEIKLIFERKLEEVEEKPLDTDIVESLANDKRLASFYGTVKQKCKNHVSFVKAGTKVVMTDTEDDIPNYLDAKWKRFWECAKKKLHDEGNWKSISFELLKDMVKIAVNQVDHPLHALWEHIKNQMVTDNTKVQIPPNLLREKIDSMLH